MAIVVEGNTREMVNHPSHYMRNGKEAIDYIEKYNYGFNQGNVVKYLWRVGQKFNDEEDVKKAKWYFIREVTRLVKQHNVTRDALARDWVADTVFKNISLAFTDAGMDEAKDLVSSWCNDWKKSEKELDKYQKRVSDWCDDWNTAEKELDKDQKVDLF